MIHHLLHSMPILLSATALAASFVVLFVGRRMGRIAFRHALAPALFLGAHGAVGLVMFLGRELGISHQSVGTIATMLDATSIALIVWMLVDAASAIAQVRAELHASRIRAREYERARRDYETLMRHRIANPLQVLSGGVATLRELDEVLDATDRGTLLAAMADAARQVEHAALAPDPISVEEHGLAGRPRLAIAAAS